MPGVDKNVKHVFHQYVLRVEDEYPRVRDELADCLIEKGISAAIHYPHPINKQPLYLDLGYGGINCPNTEDACRKVLSLPVDPLVDRKDIKYILSVFEDLS